MPVRSTRAIFVVYLVAIGAGLVLYTTIGIVRGGEDSEPADIVAEFGQALQSGDGAGACRLLSPAARSTVEKERKKPCDQAIVEVRQDVAVNGKLEETKVAESSAIVRTSQDEAVFLDRRDGGWLVGAVGCTRQAGDAPYDCELEG